MPERHGNPLIDTASTRSFYHADGRVLIRWLMKEDDEYFYVEALFFLGNPDIRPKQEKLAKSEWSLEPIEPVMTSYIPLGE